MTPDFLKPHFVPAQRCPLCSCAQFNALYRIKELNFHKCNACGFRFMNPHLSKVGMGYLYENSEILAQVNVALVNYYEFGVVNRKSRTVRDFNRVLKYVKSKIQSRSPFLFEVGYGSGGFLREGKSLGWQVDGIDTSHQNSDFLKKNHGISLKCGTFDDMQISESVTDFVAMWDVIEHTMIPRDFARKAFRMLKPGGFILLATPNIDSLLNLVVESIYKLSRQKVAFGVNQLYVLEHVGYYNTNTLMRLVKDEGFLVSKVFYSDTDLTRYNFSLFLRISLSIFFFFARLVRRQNRVLLIAQKPHE